GDPRRPALARGRLGRGPGAPERARRAPSRSRARGGPAAALRGRDDVARGRIADVPPRERRRRRRLRDHARAARLGPSPERGAARRAPPRARHAAAARDPPRTRGRGGREEAVEARRGRDGRLPARCRLPGGGGARLPRGARPAAPRRAPRPRANPVAVGRRARAPRRRRPGGPARRAGRGRAARPRRARPRRGAGPRRARARPAGKERTGRGVRDAFALRRAARAAPGGAREGRGEGGRPRAEGRRRRPPRAAGGAHRRRARTGALGRPAGAAARRGPSPRTTLSVLRLYDTSTRSLVELPAAPGPIRMYFCGPTVYARAHLGNARPFVFGMWLRSWLRATGYEVQLVHNITDVNDKIYDAAPGASAALAEQATRWYLEDTGDLGLGLPDLLPKATDAIPSIVAFIEQLIRAGHAYESGGDVYFRVSSFPEYGRLSGQRPDAVEQGEERSSLKESQSDFALWKANKPATEDTWWDSPWGRGRPGWHIECSAMAEDAFGPAFEIHGGGLDLVFPHHENEVAQSRALGHPFASIWAHNGMLRPVGGDKMSKSLGNIETIRDVLDRWGREAILVYFLTASWRKPIDYSDELMGQAA